MFYWDVITKANPSKSAINPTRKDYDLAIIIDSFRQDYFTKNI